MSAREDARGLPEDHARFAAVLSESVARRNLTLERISAKLREAGHPVSIATLSYWQTGRSLPTRASSVAAVEELERILRVPVGHLTSALPRDTVTRWDPIAEAATSDQGELLLREMGFSTARHFTTQWVQDSIEVDEGQHHQRETTRQVMQASVDGMDRVPLVFRQSDIQENPPAIEALTGCELGRVIQLDEPMMVAAELLLPRSLARDEMAMVEYRVTWDIGDEEDHGFARVLTTPVHFHVISVSIHGSPPARAEYFTGTGANGTDDEHLLHQPIPAGNFLQIVLADPVPGIHGLSWQF